MILPLGVKQRFSTGHVPQTTGKSEGFNQSLATMLIQYATEH